MRRIGWVGLCVAVACGLLGASPAGAGAVVLTLGNPGALGPPVAVTAFSTNMKFEALPLDGTVSCGSTEMSGTLLTNKKPTDEASITGAAASGCSVVGPATSVSVFALDFPWTMLLKRTGVVTIAPMELEFGFAGPGLGGECWYLAKRVKGKFVPTNTPALLKIVFTNQVFKLRMHAGTCAKQGLFSATVEMESGSKLVEEEV